MRLRELEVGGRFRVQGDDHVWVNEGPGSGVMVQAWYIYKDGTNEGTTTHGDLDVVKVD